MGACALCRLVSQGIGVPSSGWVAEVHVSTYYTTQAIGPLVYKPVDI